MIAQVLAAILALAPALDVDRATRYATDIDIAANGDTDLALVLVVTAEGESSFIESRETCRTTGDHGKAITLYQLHKDFGAWGDSTRAELCASNALATQRAAAWLSSLRQKTGGWRGAIRAYIGCTADDPRAQRRLRNFRKLKGL